MVDRGESNTISPTQRARGNLFSWHEQLWHHHMPSLDNRVNAFPLGNPNNLIHKLHHCCHVFSTVMTFVMYSMEAWKGSINNNCTLVFLNIKKKKYCHTFALLYVLKHLCCVSCLIATTQGRQAIAPHCGFTLYQKTSYRASLLCLFWPKEKNNLLLSCMAAHWKLNYLATFTNQ